MAFHKKEQITFLMSSRCNLGCKYCYMPKHNELQPPQQIDLDFAAVGLRDFFSTSESRTIRFFAPGEPTQALSAMKTIWKDAKSLAGDKLRTELETNGFFGRSVADWIEDHINYLWISCDGPSEIQDTQRPTMRGAGSSERVHSNIIRFAKREGIQTGVRATLQYSWLDRQVELIEFFHSLGVRYVAASPTYHSSQNPSIQTPPLLEFAKGFVPAYYRAQELGMTYLTLMIVNFDEPTDIYCQAHIPTPRLTTDGYVSCCDWAAFGDRSSVGIRGAELIYGRFDRSKKKIVYDPEKIAAIRRRNANYLASSFCNGCPALKHCAGGCVGKMMAATGDLYEPSKDWCEAVRYLFQRLPTSQELFSVLHP